MRVGEEGEGEAALRRGVDGVEEGSHPALGPKQGALGPLNALARELLRAWTSPVTTASVRLPRPSQCRAPLSPSRAILQGARVHLCAFPAHGLSSALLRPYGLRSIGVVVGEFTRGHTVPRPLRPEPTSGVV